MKFKLSLTALLFCVSVTTILRAQSLTTEALQKRHTDALNLFFYNNTLRMLNQNEDQDFDALIRDIEKMRLVLIRKENDKFGQSDYRKLVSDYKAEAFQEIMTSRHAGKSFDVFMKENNGKTSGMLVLINDSTNLYVLDILGRIALDKITKLYTILDESSDVSSRIRAFTGADDDNDDPEKGKN